MPAKDNKKACTTPSVQKCLHCKEPECTCKNRVPYAPDEIEALIAAEMFGSHNVAAKYKQAAKYLKSNAHDDE